MTAYKSKSKDASSGFNFFDKIKSARQRRDRIYDFAFSVGGDVKNNKFYESWAWRRKRQAILKRDKFICQECKRFGRKRNGLPVPAELVHHIKPYETNPELGLEDSNLVSLCEGCHNKKHPERAGEKRGTPPRYDKKW